MTFLFKNSLFLCLCYWLIEETNVTEHYERTKFDLYKDDICPVLTLTYVLMFNFLSLFYIDRYIHTLHIDYYNYPSLFDIILDTSFVIICKLFYQLMWN